MHIVLQTFTGWGAEPQGASPKTPLGKAPIPEPCLLPQVARPNFSWIQGMARQLRGAGKAASTKQPQTFFVAELGCFGLNFESIQQSSVPSRIRPILSKAVCLASVPWSVYTEGGKREILHWGERQREAITKICSNVGFLLGRGGEGVC